MDKTRLLLTVLFVVLICFSLAGCTALSSSPRPRPGSYPAASSFIDCNSLGNHNSGSFIGERDGIVYTVSGGHIDIAHLRIAADNVEYVYHRTRELLESGETDYTCKLTTDPSIFAVSISYPSNFARLSGSYAAKYN